MSSPPPLKRSTHIMLYSQILQQGQHQILKYTHQDGDIHGCHIWPFSSRRGGNKAMRNHEEHQRKRWDHHLRSSRPCDICLRVVLMPPPLPTFDNHCDNWSKQSAIATLVIRRPDLQLFPWVSDILLQMVVMGKQQLGCNKLMP